MGTLEYAVPGWAAKEKVNRQLERATASRRLRETKTIMLGGKGVPYVGNRRENRRFSDTAGPNTKNRHEDVL